MNKWIFLVFAVCVGCSGAGPDAGTGAGTRDGCGAPSGAAGAPGAPGAPGAVQTDAPAHPTELVGNWRTHDVRIDEQLRFSIFADGSCAHIQNDPGSPPDAGSWSVTGPAEPGFDAPWILQMHFQNIDWALTYFVVATAPDQFTVLADDQGTNVPQVFQREP